MSRGQVRTLRPDGTRQRWLGSIGGVSGLKYSYTIPGGCEQMTCYLAMDDRARTDATDPGRLVQVIRGGSIVWDGTLIEPQQGGGWQIEAAGSGTWGARYDATYTGAWATAAPDTVIGDAVSRGLGWLPSAIGHPSGMFLGQPPDSGGIMIDAMLNQLTSTGGLTWWARRSAAGNLLQCFTIPTAPTRLLVVSEPVPRTLGGDFNAVSVRYCSVPDLGQGYPAAFSNVWAVDQPSIDKHGRTEAFLDLSNAGAMLSSDAQNVGLAVLKRYQRASFAGPFVAAPGQLRTVGGQPVDLGCFFQGNDGPMVCKLLLTDQAYGGEVIPGPVTFLVGRYEYDDDADMAAITPFQTPDEDFGGLLSAGQAGAHGRRVSVSRGQGRLIWWFGKYAKSWSDIHLRHQIGYKPPQHKHRMRPPHHVNRHRHWN